MSYQILVMKEDGRNIIQESETIPEEWPVSVYDEATSHNIVSCKRVKKKVITLPVDDKKYLLVSENNGIVSSAEMINAIKKSKLEPIE